MAGKQWGSLCPDGHGILADRPEWIARGVQWCGHEDHGGNGRFWRTTEVEEGWYDPTRPPVKSAAQLEREEHARQLGLEAVAVREAREARQRKERRMTDTTTKTPKAAKAPRDCSCGCGGQTKGGRFIPGHDARYHGRIRKLEAAGMPHAEAEQVATQGDAAFTAAYAKIAPAKPAASNGTATEGAGTAVNAVPKPTRKGKSAKAKATSAPADEAPAEEADIPL